MYQERERERQRKRIRAKKLFRKIKDSSGITGKLFLGNLEFSRRILPGIEVKIFKIYREKPLSGLTGKIHESA